MIRLLIVFSLIVLATSCKKNMVEAEVCTTCDEGNFIGTVDSDTVMVFYVGDTPIILLLDFPLTYSFKTKYDLCNTSDLDLVPNAKIIVLSGSLYASCDSNDLEMLKINDFHQIHYCPKETEIVPNPSNIFEVFWLIESIQTADTTLYAPCEIEVPPLVRFESNGTNNIGLVASVGANGYYWGGVYNDSTMFFDDCVATLAYSHSIAVNNFESAYNKLFGIDKLRFIYYDIHGSLLTLTNREDSITIKMNAIKKEW